MPDVKFVAHGASYSLSLAESGAVLALTKPATCLSSTPSDSRPVSCKSAADRGQGVIRMSLAGALKPQSVAGENELSGKVNYLVGNDPALWRTNVPTYAKVRYDGVYPGIDLIYYGNQSQLEYDFVVAPGASADAIRLIFSGEDGLRINADGDLMLQGKSGSAALQRPSIYQVKNGRRQIVPGHFRLASNGSVRFSIGGYDHTLPLVIDPILLYSTYLGGSGSGGRGDEANGIAVDAAGNAYVVGVATSTNFPVTGAAYQTTINKAPSAAYTGTVFISKFNPSGTALIYSTYLGGTGGDVGTAIDLDAAGNAYITGHTSSTDFPVTASAFQKVNTASANYGNSVVFVTELNSHGNGLVYSTFLGATSPHGGVFGDSGTAIKVNAAGNAYVTGFTYASDYPVTSGAFQTSYKGAAINSPNAFVTELDSTGSSLVYSSFLGGSGHSYQGYGLGEYAYGLALDEAGDAFVVGNTVSQNFPLVAFPAPYQRKCLNLCGFVTKVNPTGTKLLYSTYFGNGSYIDPLNLGFSLTGVVVDASGDAYLSGTGGGFTTTSGAVYPASTGASGAFAAKLNATGIPLYATYVTNVASAANGLAVDAEGDAIIAGQVLATPAQSADLIGPAVLDGPEGFVAKLNATGTALKYSTMIGGSSNVDDSLSGIVVDPTGAAYVTGTAESTDYPTTSGAFQTSTRAASSYTGNAIVSKLDLSGETVDHFTTATVLNLSANQTTHGDPLTITAVVTNVSGGPTPAGSVSIVGIRKPPTVVPLDSTGTATLTTSTTTPGKYNVSAVYNGDSGHLGSSAGPTALTVIGGAGIVTFPDQYRYDVYGWTTPVTASVQDNGRNPLANQEVTFSSPGFVFSPNPGKTGANGLVTVSATATEAGTNQITASVPGVLKAATGAWTTYPATLSIRVGPPTRFYGSPNPDFAITMSGAVGTDVFNITATTTATITSPVGVYPVTVAVTGAEIANYSVNVVGQTLTIKPAPLQLAASNYQSIYGQTPAAPKAYTLAGFVNGQNSSIVTGVPSLSINATAASPVGAYPIKATAGSLSAPNYTVAPGGPQGLLVITKAPLTLAANNLTMPRGGPVPELTWSWSGFLNGDTAASAITGTPILSTAVTAATKPGSYPILMKIGTVKGADYSVTTVNGVLTVTP